MQNNSFEKFKIETMVKEKTPTLTFLTVNIKQMASKDQIEIEFQNYRNGS